MQSLATVEAMLPNALHLWGMHSNNSAILIGYIKGYSSTVAVFSPQTRINVNTYRAIFSAI